MATITAVCLLLWASVQLASSAHLFTEVPSLATSASAAGNRKIVIPAILKPPKVKATSSASILNDGGGPFPIKVVSVNKALLQSMPAELSLLLPGQFKPLQAVHRPQVLAPPNVWVGELKDSPSPASGVALTYSPDTQQVYGDVWFVDPITGNNRAFWVCPVVWEEQEANGTAVAAATRKRTRQTATTTIDPQLNVVIEHYGPSDKKNIPLKTQKKKPAKKHNTSKVSSHVKAPQAAVKRNNSAPAATAANNPLYRGQSSPAQRLEHFRQQKRKEYKAKHHIGETTSKRLYENVPNPAFTAGQVLEPTAGLPKAGETTAVASAAVGPAATNTVDVLVVATQAAVDAANGMVALQSSAKLAISQANLAHSSSNTGMQLRLIGADSLPDRSVRVVNYNENGFSASTILNHLRSGVVPNARQWREDFGADVVVLFNTNSEVCGVGYFSEGSDGKGFTDWAYSAVMKGCWEGFTTAHEIGHNLGCTHDWDTDWSSSENYPQYAHGFKACSLGSSRAYNTIMSYGNCGSFRARRVALFSNPDVRYQGVNAGDKNKADCAGRIRITSPAVSSYRASQGGGGGPGGGGSGGCSSDQYECDGDCVSKAECCPSVTSSTALGGCSWDQVCDADSRQCKSRCSSSEYACGTERNHASRFCIPLGTCCTRLPDSCVQPFDCPFDGGACKCPKKKKCSSRCPSGQKECNGFCINNDSCCTSPDDCPTDQYCPDDGSQCEDLCDSGERLCDGEFCIQDGNCCLASADDDCPSPFFCPDDDEPCQCSYDDGTPCCGDGQKDCGGKCIPEDTCCTSDDCNWDEYCPTAGETCTGRCDEGYKLCGEWCYEKPAGGDVCCLSNPGGDDCGEATTGEQLSCPEDGGTCSCGDDKKACPSDDGISCIELDRCCPALDECSAPYVCIDFQCRCPEGRKECYNSESDSTSCIPEDSCCIWDEDCPENLFCPEDGGQCQCADDTCMATGEPVCYTSDGKTCCTDTDCRDKRGTNFICRKQNKAALGKCQKCANGFKPCNGKCIRRAQRCNPRSSGGG